MNRVEALAQALALAVTAPEDEQSLRALRLAANIASGMSDAQIKRAKRMATNIASGMSDAQLKRAKRMAEKLVES